ncbi:MAG: hypothetical protein HOV81_02260, partial [Kofleriaceae bacterium]|nr:hypothetical protein [Kofleriaceae bacterium]
MTRARRHLPSLAVPLSTLVLASTTVAADPDPKAKDPDTVATAESPEVAPKTT